MTKPPTPIERGITPIGPRIVDTLESIIEGLNRLSPDADRLPRDLVEWFRGFDDVVWSTVEQIEEGEI